jgi:hypothetical protein
MKTIRFLTLGFAILAVAAFGRDSKAADRAVGAYKTTPFAQLSCDNGHTYSVVSYAMTLDGDLVTGYLFVTPRRSVHVRLVPMEHGYRYIGPGLYFEGVRQMATLYFGKSVGVACEVTFAGQAA